MSSSFMLRRFCRPIVTASAAVVVAPRTTHSFLSQTNRTPFPFVLAGKMSSTKMGSSFSYMLRGFSSYSTTSTSAGDDIAAAVAPTTENEERSLKIFTDLDKFRHQHIYTKNMKILILNEDNFEFAAWIQDTFAGVGMVWAARDGVPDDKVLKNKNWKENVKRLQPSVPEKTVADKRDEKKKKKKEEKEKKEKNKADRKKERLGKKLKKKKEEEEEEKRKEEEEKRKEEEEKRKEEQAQSHVFFKLSVKNLIEDTDFFKKQGLTFDRVVLRLAYGQTWEEVSDVFLASQDSLTAGGEFHVFARRNGPQNKWDHKELATSYEIVVHQIWFDYGPDKHPYTIWRYFDEALHEKMIKEQDKKEEGKYIEK